MSELYLGFDTSCYTTSVACVNEDGIVLDERTVLSVAFGTRGLRQSEALFQHIKNLPILTRRVLEQADVTRIRAVAVSAQPVLAPESYMPVFLAGKNTAVSVASALKVPLIETAHQYGHVRAALFGNDALFAEPSFLAMHISGGTTDMLRVSMDHGQIASITCLGSSGDLHAGQLVDRIGVALSLPFPCGRHLEALAREATARDVHVPSSVKGVTCSFSGAETQLQRAVEDGLAPEETAYAVYDVLARTIAKMIRNAAALTGERFILLSGGVASSNLLRELLHKRLPEGGLFFGMPALSSDNAVGVALLARDHFSGAER